MVSINKVNKLGVLVSSLSHSQQSYELVKSVNQFVENNKNVDVCLFTESTSPPLFEINTAVMGLYDVWGYDGTIIATNLSTAKTINNIPGTNRKLFYVYNFEWIHNPYTFYEYIEMCKNLDIINRTPSHAKIFKNNFNKDSIFTLPEFDLEEIWTKLNTKTT